VVTDGNEPETLAKVVDYTRIKLAPERRKGNKDHWFDEVKDGFDTIWCAVARLELMLHCGMTSEQVGGPVLVKCSDKDKIAETLRKECPYPEDDATVLMMYVKKPPPGAKPWG
jgi:hypothetical protein